MLKKAGIVVAAAAVGLLAVSPLAFAGEKSHGHGHGHGYDQTNTATESSQGLVNISDINANVPVNALNCLDADVPVLGLNENVVPIAGALALLGAAESENNTAIDDSCANAQGASSVDNVGQENEDD
ncbi:MAG: hypothetical protein ABWY11_21070 [Umezawaea sp.]